MRFLHVAIGLYTARAFQPSAAVPSSRIVTSMSSTVAGTTNNEEKSSYLYDPAARDAHYSSNIASYLLDLNESGATFDFCGGMLFQLVLSKKLQSHLESVAASEDSMTQPVLHPASQPLMDRIPDYSKSAFADNIAIFHGRELRKIPAANGGMGFVLQLSYADESGTLSTEGDAGKGADASWTAKAVDPQGWSAQEIAVYDGWRSDSLRQWRNAKKYKDEGWDIAKDLGSEDSFGLNHRCYLHLDGQNKMWLSAEDGCEGTPSSGKSLLGKLGGMLFGRR